LCPLFLVRLSWCMARKGGCSVMMAAGWEFPAFWTVALVVQAMLGSGALSLGRALGIEWL
jgi:putative oxidoreductase